MSQAEKKSKAKTQTALLSILVAGGLGLLKLAAFGWTGSLALLASLTDSLLDFLASGLNYFAIRTSLQPADSDHAYGHGKAESLAGLFQSLLVGVSGCAVLLAAIQRMESPPELQAEALGIAVMVVSLIATILLVRRMRRVARESDSVALQADSLHYATDVLANLAVLGSFVGHWLFEVRWLDPLVSLGIAFYVLGSAWEILRTSIDELMDRQLPLEDLDRISGIVSQFVPDIVGYHDLRTRKAAGQVFIDLHLEIPRDLSFVRAHRSAEAVVNALKKAFPGATVTAHADPFPAPDGDTPELSDFHAETFVSDTKS